MDENLSPEELKKRVRQLSEQLETMQLDNRALGQNVDALSSELRQVNESLAKTTQLLENLPLFRLLRWWQRLSGKK